MSSAVIKSISLTIVNQRSSSRGRYAEVDSFDEGKDRRSSSKKAKPCRRRLPIDACVNEVKDSRSPK